MKIHIATDVRELHALVDDPRYIEITLTKEQLQAALTAPAPSIDRLRAEIDGHILEQQQRALEWLRKPIAPSSEVTDLTAHTPESP